MLAAMTVLPICEASPVSERHRPEGSVLREHLSALHAAGASFERLSGELERYSFQLTAPEHADLQLFFSSLAWEGCAETSHRSLPAVSLV